MKKTMIVYAVALAVTLGFGFAGTQVMAEEKGPAEIVLGEGGKKPAPFPHQAHQQMEGVTCGECHHGAENGKQVPYQEGMEIKGCASCHNDSMENKKLNSFMKAGHENCKGCHKEAAKEGKNAPTKCSGCHK